MPPKWLPCLALLYIALACALAPGLRADDDLALVSLTPGTHAGAVWRGCLSDFAPLLFRWAATLLAFVASAYKIWGA